VDKIAKVRRVGLGLSHELGREATDEEIAEEVGMNAAKVTLLKQAAIRPTSLDAPIGEDDASAFGDFVGDEAATDPFEHLRDKNLQEEVADLLDQLDTRERKIINARFGLDGSEPVTLEEVGVEFCVTRERIRQIQNIALEKMRRALNKREQINSEVMAQAA
jgi:RNA polymerase primary sigma factor